MGPDTFHVRSEFDRFLGAYRYCVGLTHIVNDFLDAVLILLSSYLGLGENNIL